MIRKFNILVLSFAATIPAFAMDAAQAEAKQTVPLVNGETLYIFKDGKMAKANQYGRTAYLAKGEVVQSVDGQKISTVGSGQRSRSPRLPGAQGSSKLMASLA